MTPTLKYFDGTTWKASFPAATPPPPDVQTFTSSGTWTKPAGARLIIAESISGGAGTSQAYPGAGGGYGRMSFSAGDLSATGPVTVGAAGPTSSGSSPSDGGNSSFAGLVVIGGHGVSGQTTLAAWGGGQPDGIAFGTAPSVNGQFIGGASTPVPSGTAQSSQFGAGGGAINGTVGVGGTSASMFGALQAGNGGSNAQAATAPGGGAGANGTAAPGALRITTYF